ncbi:uncharacterized protein KY384_006613 [Bacidia gigantensis]|uniref:uncharacterized protein n=1 Tax=Bacidia gigantensis TaxID=2732470 RepID=UPI001D0537FD|nr:uncharacterized protein KY384_006613 [Bacidia gigantensis]KAG8528924.1 hypothetical protein KY384_006613 [Bacidia gigantensis]
MSAATTQPTPYAPQYQQAYTTPPNSQGHPQYNLLQQQRHYSPTASHPQTPSPNSPASPQPSAPSAESLPPLLASRPTKPPQLPIDGKPAYLPAALRPTDPPPRSQPLTPPRSVHGSTDSLAPKGTTSRPASRRSTADSSLKKTFGNIEHLSHIPSDDLEVALTKTSDMPDPSSAPTREHWKPDVNASICDFPICQKSFGLFERRHHCRHCGNVFCNQHSAERIPLDQDAEFHPKASLVRSCEHCAKLFVGWVEQRVEDLKSPDAATPRRTSPMALAARASQQNQADVHRGTIISGSVGGDWSTF